MVDRLPVAMILGVTIGRVIEIMNEEFKKRIEDLRRDCYDRDLNNVNPQLLSMLHLIDQLAEKVEWHEKYIEDLEYEVRQLQIQQNGC